MTKQVINISAMALALGMEDNELLDALGIDDHRDNKQRLLDELKEKIAIWHPGRVPTFIILAAHYLEYVEDYST